MRHGYLFFKNLLPLRQICWGSVPENFNCYLNYPISLLISENIFVKIPSNQRLKPALASLFP